MTFIELLRKAQFHGAKRLADTEYRWCWFIALIALLCSSLVVLCVTINRYFNNPTFIVKKESIENNLLFPTVYVCPEVNYRRHKMDAFVNEIEYPPNLNATYIRSVLRQLAAFVSPDVMFVEEDLERIQDVLEYNNLDVETVGIQLTQTCDEILIRCRWRGTIVNCSALFQLDVTRNGYCCVFNGRSLKREMEQFGSARVFPNSAVGVRTDDVGFANALMLAVDQNHELLYDIDLDYKWLSVQTGQHYVEFNTNGTAISPGEELWVSFYTRTMQISDEAEGLSNDLRRCNLAHEPLKYFPLYHKSYCLVECEMERTMKRCQCLKIAHPRLPGIPLCYARKLKCARRAAVSYSIEECNCRPTCNVELHNSIPIKSYELIPGSPTYDNFYDDLDFTKVTIIRIYIKNLYKNIWQHKSYFTTFNLISQLGGVFNVFFGCSMLTILEICLLIWHGFRRHTTRN